MRIRSKLKSIEWDMTPMIDVVFLLIVFFTLVMNFVVADQDERIRLPISELAQPPELPTAQPITLHVLPDGNVIYRGLELSLHGLREEIRHDLRVLHHLNIPVSDVTVIIRADAQVEIGRVLDIIELCQRLELNRFIWRARQREQ